MKPDTRARSLALGAAIVAGLLLVFGAYLNPHLAVELANSLWACF